MRAGGLEVRDVRYYEWRKLMIGSDRIRKGVDVGRLLFGAGMAGAGAVFIALAVIGNYTLRFHGILLPRWSMYVIAGVLMLAGGALIQAAARAWKCANCGTPLQYGEAFFPADREADILHAVEKLDASILAGVPAFEGGAEWITFSIDFCDRCGEVGVISVVKCNAERQKRAMRPPVILSKEALTAFLPHTRPAPRTGPLMLD